ncbi:MAG: AsmA-like C-terminal region-containing protein [Nitrosomonadales bacterium]
MVNPDLPIPFAFNASTSGASIKLSGDIERPFAKKDIELSLDMSGNRFDNLDSLMHTSLPPWGPWSLTGKFMMSSKGYEVPALKLKVGSSRLKGHGKVDTTVTPPRIDVALDATTIQLDDFKFGDWSPEKAKPKVTVTPPRLDAQEEPMADSELTQEVSKESNRVQQILSPEVLRRQNAYLSVRVDRVLSGKDMLGNGSLNAKLANGRADIGPLVVNMPGGSASLQIGYEPGKKDIAVNLRAEVKRFDYGVLARRFDQTSEMRGLFNLDIDVSARAQTLSEILRYGKGHIDFAIWPENMKSGLLDIWAVNVLMALLPAVDSANTSKVNCAIGRFVLEDGKLSHKTILIDTSRMRVTGKGGVGFAEEDIRFYVQPHAKTPQFLSLAIPLEVSGKFNDFHVGVSPADIVETVGQFATSIVWVPIEMLFGKETPADGHDVCLAEKE